VSTWDPRSGLSVQTYYGHRNSVNGVAYTLAGSTIASTDAGAAALGGGAVLEAREAGVRLRLVGLVLARMRGASWVGAEALVLRGEGGIGGGGPRGGAANRQGAPALSPPPAPRPDGVVKLWDVRMVAEITTIGSSKYPANKAAFDASGAVRGGPRAGSRALSALLAASGSAQLHARARAPSCPRPRRCGTGLVCRPGRPHRTGWPR
jgi:hypothetical protein